MRHREQQGATEAATGVATPVAVGVPSAGLESKSKASARSKEDSKVDADGSVKITITKEAASGLKELIDRVNDGFDAGQVHRQDVASWILSRFTSSVGDTEINEIREAHYDDSAMFEAMYRRMKETGEVPQYLRDAMRSQFQASPETPKKNKKALTPKYIKDVHSSHEDTA